MLLACKASANEARKPFRVIEDRGQVSQVLDLQVCAGFWGKGTDSTASNNTRVGQVRLVQAAAHETTAPPAECGCSLFSRDIRGYSPSRPLFSEGTIRRRPIPRARRRQETCWNGGPYRLRVGNYRVAYQLDNGRPAERTTACAV
jgi:hypothetical protein